MPRDDSIDALRGLAIVLVVIGHAIVLTAWVHTAGAGLIREGVTFWIPISTASSGLLGLIFAFHMPLFAFVSGLVMWPPRDYPLTTQVLRRAGRLLVPYMAWCVILLFAARSAIDLPSESLGKALLDLVAGRGGLWFLYALFICIVVVLCLGRTPRPRATLAVTALVAIAWSSGILPIPNVLYLGYVLWIYPFVALGYMMGPLKSQVPKYRWLTVAAGLIIFLSLFYVLNPVLVPQLSLSWHLSTTISRWAVTMHNAGFHGGYIVSASWEFLTRLGRYVCALGALLVLYGLYAGRSGKAVDLQAWLGQKSLGVYVLEFPLLIWLIGAGLRNVLVLSVVTLVLAAGLTVLLERIPILDLVLLGKNTAHLPARPAGREVSDPHPTPVEDSASL